MSRLEIDFAAPGVQRALYHTSAVSWLLLAAALVLVLTAGVLTGRLLGQQSKQRAELAAARARAATPVVVAVEKSAPKISEVQAGAVNAAALQLNLPWRALHDAIGAATPPEIAMLALEPDARKRTMKITAEAKTSDAMIGYVEELKKQELFTGVALSRHEINELDPARPIRFQIEAEWSAP